MRLYIITESPLEKANAILAQQCLADKGIQAELLHKHCSNADEIPWEDTYYSHAVKEKNVEGKTSIQLCLTREQEHIYNMGMSFMDAIKKASLELDSEFCIVHGSQCDGRLQNNIASLIEKLHESGEKIAVGKFQNDTIPILLFKKQGIAELMERLKAETYNIDNL